MNVANLVCRDDLILAVDFIGAYCAEKLFFLLGLIITQPHTLGMIPFVTLITLNVKHVWVKGLQASAKCLPFVIRRIKDFLKRRVLGAGKVS